MRGSAAPISAAPPTISRSCRASRRCAKHPTPCVSLRQPREPCVRLLRVDLRGAARRRRRVDYLRGDRRRPVRVQGDRLSGVLCRLIGGGTVVGGCRATDGVCRLAGGVCRLPVGVTVTETVVTVGDCGVTVGVCEVPFGGCGVTFVCGVTVGVCEATVGVCGV